MPNCKGQEEESITRLISTSPGSLSHLETLRPAVKQRGGANALGLALEVSTVGELRLFKLVAALERAVDQGHVGKGSQMLGGLEFWGIRREEEQRDMVGRTQAL
jgi:hypothetical protein